MPVRNVAWVAGWVTQPIITEYSVIEQSEIYYVS